MESQQCPVCDTTFISKRGNRGQTYCSRACYTIGRTGKERPSAQRRTIKTCAQCSKEFMTGGSSGKSTRATYCSTACAGAAHRNRFICRQCGKEVIGRKGGKRGGFCSTACYADSVRGNGASLLDLTCTHCGKGFQRYAGQVRNPERVYCSGTCRAAGRSYASGKDHAQWKGGTYISGSTGYLYEVDHTRPPKPSGGYPYVAQHIRIAQEKLGRSLDKGEHVHHLDGNKLNNDPSNLMVLPSGVHRALHGFYSEQFQKEHAAKGDIVELAQSFVAAALNKRGPTP